MEEKLKILIVDDDEIILLLQRKFLQKCGISSNIHSFKSGQKALDYLKAETDGIAILILLDINMPGLSGWQFLDKLESLSLTQEVFVIMVSSSTKEIEMDTIKIYDRIIGSIEKPVTFKNCEEIKRMPQLAKYI